MISKKTRLIRESNAILKMLMAVVRFVELDSLQFVTQRPLIRNMLVKSIGKIKKLIDGIEDWKPL